MTPFYLVRSPIMLPALHRWAGERNIGWTARSSEEGREANASFDEGNALHHLLSESFGKGVLQPFRLFVAPGQNRASLYAYSSADKSELIETLRACALPEALTICDPDALEIKEMPQDWRDGRQLGFETRIRPVRRLFKPCGKFPKGAEIDAFLVEGLRQFPDKPPANAAERLKREDVYRQWLAERFDGAAELTAARLTSFSRCRAARNGRAVQGPDANIQGELIIRDPERFAERLAKGIGRHTAYGFGMLLIRPPGRR